MTTVRNIRFSKQVFELIHDFSRPQMRFVNEFHKAVKDLTSHHYLDLPSAFKNECDGLLTEIYQKLFTDDAEKVIVAFMAYVDATIALRNLPYYKMFPQTPTEILEKQAYSEACNLIDKTVQDVRVALYGEEIVKTDNLDWIPNYTDEEYEERMRM
jgi:hypothetical protein